MLICAVGVVIDMSVITVAPIALSIGQRAGYNRASLLLAMIGGGKAGNIISPNPNTIAVAEAFEVNLTSLMAKNAIPAACALIMTIILATFLAKRSRVNVSEASGKDSDFTEKKELPTFLQAIEGPAVVILLLGLRSVASTELNPPIPPPAEGSASSRPCRPLPLLRKSQHFESH